MTLDEAREHIGDGAIYRSFPAGLPEQGVITSVNDRFVFVHYSSNVGSLATPPEMLTLLAAKPSQESP